MHSASRNSVNTNRVNRNRAIGQRAGAALAVAALSLGLAACGDGNDGTPEDTSNAPQPSASQPAPPPGPTGEPAPDGSVTREQAGQIVTDAYGGEVLDVEADTAQGQPSWEVEVRDSREGRIEVDVSQRNGEMLEMEHD